MRLIDFECELQSITESRVINCFPAYANMAFAIPRERQRELPFHRAKASGTLERAAQSLRLFQEGLEFLGPQISTKASPEASSYDLKFTIDPVGVPLIEQSGMGPRQRPNQDVLCT